MHEDRHSHDVGSSFSPVAIVAGIVALAVLLGGFLFYRGVSDEQAFPPVTIATGPTTGTYHAMGLALKRVLESSGQFSTVELRQTDGSVENMRLVSTLFDGVDFAFVQADEAPATYARLVSALYDEYLHILVREDAEGIRTVYDLDGARVSLGTAGSGTRELSQRVLTHFRVEPGEDRLLGPADAAQALRSGDLDAVFLLTAIPSRLVDQLASGGGLRFLPLGEPAEEGGEADALALVFPGISSAMIPRASYIRLPGEPVPTVSVSALLVARSDTGEELVRAMTSLIFENRSGASGLEGADLAVARKIREDYDPAAANMPYHPGAVAYYRREDPPFFVEYAEALSLGLTLLLALYSMFIAFREWMRRRMKNRIDAYLLEVERLSGDLDNMGAESLAERRQALANLRREAFADLVSERLLADEAFTILQSHLRDELAAVEEKLARVR